MSQCQTLTKRKDHEPGIACAVVCARFASMGEAVSHVQGTIEGWSANAAALRCLQQHVTSCQRHGPIQDALDQGAARQLSPQTQRQTMLPLVLASDVGSTQTGTHSFTRWKRNTYCQSGFSHPHTEGSTSACLTLRFCAVAAPLVGVLGRPGQLGPQRQIRQNADLTKDARDALGRLRAQRQPVLGALHVQQQVLVAVLLCTRSCR